MDTRPRWFISMALIAVVMLLGSACSDDTDSAAGTDGTTGTSADGPGEEDTGDPVPGGTLVIALEAETDGFDPRINRWATSGHFAAQAMFDTLAMFDENGEVQPYLAESIEPNDDFTEWAITLREGITFHDGTPLDAEAVAFNIEQHTLSPLSSPSVRPIEAVEPVDDLTVRVTMSEPWSSFPVFLSMAQVGYVAAPSQLEDTATAPQNPIGTGPFMLDDWVPDSHMKLVRNPDYWRADDNGTPLPYLDGVEFRMIVEAASRDQALAAGDIQMQHTTEPDSLVDYQAEADAGEVVYADDNGVGEEGMVLLNMLVPPLDDLRVRQALAHATNLELWDEVINLGVRDTARTPFGPSLPWYSQEAVDTYPEYDPGEARRLVEEYEAENGPVSFELRSQPLPANLERAALLQEMWADVGIDVDIETLVQDEFINAAVTGEYTANLWRQFGAPDPDGDSLWWDIENATEIGTVGLNFARNRDPELQAALDAGRATDDFDERKVAYDEAQIRLNTTLPYIWLTHTVWALVGDPDVRNMATYTLPDGSSGMQVVAGWPGATKLTETWLEQ